TLSVSSASFMNQETLKPGRPPRKSSGKEKDAPSPKYHPKHANASSKQMNRHLQPYRNHLLHRGRLREARNPC
ncbi:hypothetical protein CPB84DRAFT_1792383, partial [Gymnopilus junonius]